ncbi:hypothetical protein BC830DRAFT_1203471 [Chytriomyces sp. MP71]|nr:hypothetical protein BC830DRAFT_1203471 [Chytriomyces sp. MP71]
MREHLVLMILIQKYWFFFRCGVPDKVRLNHPKGHWLLESAMHRLKGGKLGKQWGCHYSQHGAKKQNDRKNRKQLLDFDAKYNPDFYVAYECQTTIAIVGQQYWDQSSAVTPKFQKNIYPKSICLYANYVGYLVGYVIENVLGYVVGCVVGYVVGFKVKDQMHSLIKFSY